MFLSTIFNQSEIIVSPRISLLSSTIMPRISVLVSFSPITHIESNKVIIIPEFHREATDLAFLRKECRNSSSFGTNVSLSVTFQKFSAEWDCFVDLDDDCCLEHKDKLKLIITPQLKDSAASTISHTDSTVPVMEGSEVNVSKFYIEIFQKWIVI